MNTMERQFFLRKYIFEVLQWKSDEILRKSWYLFLSQIDSRSNILKITSQWFLKQKNIYRINPSKHSFTPSPDFAEVSKYGIQRTFARSLPLFSEITRVSSRSLLHATKQNTQSFLKYGKESNYCSLKATGYQIWCILIKEW